jgi:hypothetical protein
MLRQVAQCLGGRRTRHVAKVDGRAILEATTDSHDLSGRRAGADKMSERLQYPVRLESYRIVRIPASTLRPEARDNDELAIR